MHGEPGNLLDVLRGANLHRLSRLLSGAGGRTASGPAALVFYRAGVLPGRCAERRSEW